MGNSERIPPADDPFELVYIEESPIRTQRAVAYQIFHDVAGGIDEHNESGKDDLTVEHIQGFIKSGRERVRKIFPNFPDPTTRHILGAARRKTLEAEERLASNPSSPEYAQKVLVMCQDTVKWLERAVENANVK